MAKQDSDRTTLDLFSAERRPGRPKTNPLPRSAQLKVNKRNQVKRDKAKGLRRVELKLHADVVEALDFAAEELGLSRSALMEKILCEQLNTDPECTPVTTQTHNA